MSINDLQSQIDVAERLISTDNYPMSIGELMSMYKEKEIDIHPEFQRAYRWDIAQKSRLIESILLGIPIPAIFVFHRKDGIWDVIDGQQRLSTIFELSGLFINEDGNKTEPLKLEKTKFLPALEGVVWENDDEEIYQLTQSQRLKIKRAKINIQLLKSTSDENAKYDLFQRLNTGGSQLTPQEMRTCLIIMKNREFYVELNTLRTYPSFAKCLPMTERAKNEQEDLEYVIRFIVARNCATDKMPSSLHDYFDDSILSLIDNMDFNIEVEKAIFKRTFDYLNDKLGENAFRRYNSTNDEFEGPISLSAFEAMTPVISKNIDIYEKADREELIKKVKLMHNHKEFAPTGRNSIFRYTAALKVGKEVF